MIDAAIDEINELRKENAELKEKLKRFEWRSIESAPRDSEDIIVYVDVATIPIVRCAYWSDGEEWSVSGFDSQEQASGWWAHTSSCGAEKMDDIYYPTHWMPLPK